VVKVVADRRASEVNIFVRATASCFQFSRVSLLACSTAIIWKAMTIFCSIFKSDMNYFSKNAFFMFGLNFGTVGLFGL